MTETRKRILILSGCGEPAVRAANVYVRRLGTQHELRIIEERGPGVRRILRFLWRRWLTYGLLHTAGTVLVFLQRVAAAGRPTAKAYQPWRVVADLNTDSAVTGLLQDWRPDLVITNACSILRAPLLAAMPCPVWNLHNGVVPRYRGTGNVWAYYDNDPERAGISLHVVDQGIDTGPPLLVQTIDFAARGVPFAELDSEAFRLGAEAMVDLVEGGAPSIAPSCRELPSRHHPIPGWRDRGVAARRYREHQESKIRAQALWRERFTRAASDQARRPWQRMEWGDDRSVPARDRAVVKLIRSRVPPGAGILDLGCGDGRLAGLLAGYRYIGCDFQPGFLAPSQGLAAVAAAEAECLPFADNAFDAVLCVGLFQHLPRISRAIDEIRRVLRPGGVVVLNTLRQPSALELAAAWLAGLGDQGRRTLVRTIAHEDYFRGIEIDGTMVARRFRRGDLVRACGTPCRLLAVHHDGLAGTALLARELTLVMNWGRP